MKEETLSRNVVSRRDSFRLFGLVGISAMFGSAATLRADDAPATKESSDLQGASYYKEKLGDVELFLISDGGFPMDTATLFGEVPAADMETAKQSMFVTTPAVPGHVNAMLVKEGSNLILIDTGCGNLFGPTTGFLPRNLKRAGFDPGQITHVVITHAHPDHIGGLVTPDNKLAFPNAHILINRAEHAFWTGESPSFAKSKLSPDGAKQMVDGAKQILGVAKPKLEMVRPDEKVGSAIRIVDAAGHTPGHVGLAIDAGGESMLYVTDAVHVPAVQLAHPDWHIQFDTDPDQSVVARKALLNLAAKERKLIAGAHIPFPAFGHVVVENAGFRFVPSIWEW